MANGLITTGLLPVHWSTVLDWPKHIFAWYGMNCVTIDLDGALVPVQCQAIAKAKADW